MGNEGGEDGKGRRGRVAHLGEGLDDIVFAVIAVHIGRDITDIIIVVQDAVGSRDLKTIQVDLRTALHGKNDPIEAAGRHEVQAVLRGRGTGDAKSDQAEFES